MQYLPEQSHASSYKSNSASGEKAVSTVAKGIGATGTPAHAANMGVKPTLCYTCQMLFSHAQPGTVISTLLYHLPLVKAGACKTIVACRHKPGDFAAMHDHIRQ